MIIRCPNCGESGEADSEPDVGQHIECPFCCTTFSYGADNIKAMPEDAPGNVQQLGAVASSCVTDDATTDSSDSSGDTVSRTSLPHGLRLVAKNTPAKASSSSVIKRIKKAANSIHKRILRIQNDFSGIKTRPAVKNIKPKKKFCQECGNELHPKAVICPKCGCPVANSKQPASWSSIDPNNVPNYMVGAIISMFLFLPTGLVAMYYVLQSKQKLRDGNRSGAEDDSRTAGFIVKWTIGIAVVGFIFVFVLGSCIGHSIQKELKSTDNYIRNATREAEREAERLSREAERIMRSANYYY